MSILRLLVLLLASCGPALMNAQERPDYFAKQHFTLADTLRGALRPERTSFDVTYYELHLEVDPENRTIEGRVDMDYRVVQPTNRLQIDLYRNLTIDSIIQNGRHLAFNRQEDAVFVRLPRLAIPAEDQTHRMSIHYGGEPVAAKNAPWDGGFVWSLDHRDRTWIGIACEGDGASLWWLRYRTEADVRGQQREPTRRSRTRK